ncbi:MAG TPA: alpha-ribazole phosphatase [Bacillota bacterium]|nr:alpha-ribazole phosphatase [Bacillota bacterium]HOR86409.1 alpha-ribazole phosphatase [Bacillota bacterium]HPL54452.1 alpha-ribazole phosphatase [Bacillota bacterium]
MNGNKTELYLIRHGETELNTKGLYCGWTDCGLSDKGIMQAEDLADIFQNISFDAVISSSLARSIITAAIVSRYDPDEIVRDDRLRELNFGAWEGMHHSEISKKYKYAWDSWGSDWKSALPPGGESFFDIYMRVKSSIEDILKEYKGKRVLVVSHLGTMRIIPTILLGLPQEACWFFTAEQGRYSHYEIDDTGYCIIRKINSGR